MIHVSEVSEFVYHRVDQRGVSQRATGASMDEANPDASIIEADAISIMRVGSVSIEFIRGQVEVRSHPCCIGTKPLNQLPVVLDHKPAPFLLRASEGQRQLRNRH